MPFSGCVVPPCVRELVTELDVRSESPFVDDMVDIIEDFRTRGVA